MPRRSSKKRDDDEVTAAFRVVAEATRESLAPEKPKKNPHAVALGRRGGRKGGKARAVALTQEERTSIALRAARARWSKKV